MTDFFHVLGKIETNHDVSKSDIKFLEEHDHYITEYIKYQKNFLSENAILLKNFFKNLNRIRNFGLLMKIVDLEQLEKEMLSTRVFISAAAIRFLENK